MTVTLADLRSSVNRRIWNNIERQSAEATSDGVKTDWKLPDENIESVERCVRSAVVMTESADASPADTEYTLDYDSGWMRFGGAGANGDVIHWDYTFSKWGLDQVDEAINSALDYIFGEFYGRTVDEITTDGSTYEGWCPQAEQVHEVSHKYTGGTRYSRLDDWRTQDYPDYIVTAYSSNYLTTPTSTSLALVASDGVFVDEGDYIKDDASREVVYVSAKSTDTLTVERGAFGTTATAHLAGATWRRWSTKMLVFANAPPAGTLRLLVTKRAPWMSAATDSLEVTCGFPQRAKEPIICYACYLLLMQRANARVMDDRSHNQLEENVVLPSDIMRQAQTMKFACDTQLQKTRMKPVRKRLVI